MEPLYKTTTKFTYDEYKKFNKAILKKKHIIFVTMIALLFILFGGILLKSIFLIIFAIVYPFLFIMAQNIGIKRVYESNKLVKDIDVTFEFYDNYFVEKHEVGEAKIPYDKLCDVIETDTNFYLMIAKNQGYMISKNNMPQERMEFIKEKIKNVHK